MVEAPACGTCRWWVPPTDDYDEGMGLCQGVRERWEIKNAPFEGKDRSEYDDWDEVERIEKEAFAEAQACVVDGSGYHAALLTRPTFGCSQHTPKEQS